jgi:hypothetical protein
MLMRGDLEKLTKGLNEVLENVFAQIAVLEKRLDHLEKPKKAPITPKPPKSQAKD